MNLKLLRNKAVQNGVYGTLLDDAGNEVCVTLEHAYQQPDGSYAAKVPSGQYTCVRGQHRLPTRPAVTFETFEITGVSGHTGILFHKGNYNNDSEGCVLVGTYIGPGCILESSMAFGHFLDVQVGCDSFLLTVG